LNDKFYKGPPPNDGSSYLDWIHHDVTLVGSGGWNAFKFLFFDPEGLLCGVETITGKFYKGTPPTFAADSWLSSATLLGSGGDWSVFHFLFFDSQGILYCIGGGEFHKRSWLGTSTLIGASGWSDFRFLFFMSDGGKLSQKCNNGCIASLSRSNLMYVS